MNCIRTHSTSVKQTASARKSPHNSMTLVMTFRSSYPFWFRLLSSWQTTTTSF